MLGGCSADPSTKDLIKWSGTGIVQAVVPTTCVVFPALFYFLTVLRRSSLQSGAILSGKC